MEGALLGIIGALLGSLITLFVALIVRQKERAPVPNPPNPDAARMGDMSVTYWMREFDRLNGQYDRLYEVLDSRLGRVEGLLQELVRKD